MGYSKLIRKSDTEVRIVHQLDEKGERYAEDATITAPPGRLSWLDKYDGKVGTFGFGFTEVAHDTSSIVFPED